LFSRTAHGYDAALSAVGDWVKKHLKDIHAVLSTISAIAGLVALVTPPPIDAVALGVSVVAGAAGLAMDIADPQFRHGIGELLYGNFNKDSIGALMTGVGDVASAIPGVGVGFNAVKGGEAAAGGIAKLASAAAHDPGLLVKGLGKIPFVKAFGESAGFVDKLFAGTLDEIGKAPDALSRLAVFWKTRGVGSDINNDVHQAGTRPGHERRNRRPGSRRRQRRHSAMGEHPDRILSAAAG
jgi:hypothetical protein